MNKMKVSWIKTKDDEKSFKVFQNLGFEETDKKIEELINDDCKIIILSNEIAAFSSDIITKYNKQDDISIIISSK